MPNHNNNRPRPQQNNKLYLENIKIKLLEDITGLIYQGELVFNNQVQKKDFIKNMINDRLFRLVNGKELVTEIMRLS